MIIKGDDGDGKVQTLADLAQDVMSVAERESFLIKRLREE